MSTDDADAWASMWLEAFNPCDPHGHLERAASSLRRTKKWHAFRKNNTLAIFYAQRPAVEATLRFERRGTSDITGFVDALAASPELYGPILADRLPLEVAEIARRCKVEFLPKNREAIALVCTCGSAKHDAMCSHGAALVQWAADQIRAAPQILFLMQGIDLKAELAARGLSIPKTDARELPTLSGVLSHAAETLAPLYGRHTGLTLADLPRPELAPLHEAPETLLSDCGGLLQADPAAWVARTRKRAAKWLSQYEELVDLYSHARTALIETLEESAADEETEEPRVSNATSESLASSENDALDAARERLQKANRALEAEMDRFRKAFATEHLTTRLEKLTLDFDREVERGVVTDRTDVKTLLANPWDICTGLEEVIPLRRKAHEDSALRLVYSENPAELEPWMRPRRHDSCAGCSPVKRLLALAGPQVEGLERQKLTVARSVDGTSVSVLRGTPVFDPEAFANVPAPTVSEIAALGDALPFEIYGAALLATDDRAAEDLEPADALWRTVFMTAAKLLSSARTVPLPWRSDTVADAIPRILHFPLASDPETAALATALTEAAGEAAETLFADGTYASESDPVKRRLMNVVEALARAASALLRLGNAAEMKPSLGVGEALMLGVSMPALEGLPANAKILESDQSPLMKTFETLLAPYLFPVRPLVVLEADGSGVRLGFGADASEAGAKGAPKPLLLPEILREKAHETLRIPMLQALAIYCGLAPELMALRNDPKSLHTLSPEALEHFFKASLPRLRLLGASVLVPESFGSFMKPRLVARLGGASSSSTPAMLDEKTLADFSWCVAIGSEVLEAAEFKQLARERRGSVVAVDGRWVWLDPETVDAVLDRLAKAKKPSVPERRRAALTGRLGDADVRADESIRAAVKRMTRIGDKIPPESLNAQLRPYQARGFSWLMKNLELGLGSLIADDMGLGKTVQVIAAMCALKEEGRLSGPAGLQALVVVPSTLLCNWERELERFAPGISHRRHHGPGRSIERLCEGPNAPDVILTTYGTLRRDAKAFAAKRFALLVADEAQAVKNRMTEQSRALAGVAAPSRIAMTGTPVENNLMEYRAVLSVVEPDLLGGETEFRRTFATPIETRKDPDALERFRRLTAPFLLRRTKRDPTIAPDLPERTTTDLFAPLTPLQTALYSQALEKNLGTIAGLGSEKDRMVRRGAILRLIGELKAICNSPSQYAHEDADAAPAAPDSGKGRLLVDLVRGLIESGRKVLVFTQFRATGERIRRWLEPVAGERPAFLHGGATLAARAAMIERFQKDRSAKVLVVSLKAGGTGLNLTAASAVVHFDLWWNPAVEAQATDRVHRIGQHRDVLVYRFVTEGTFEERINEMLEAKRGLADLAVAEGETWIGDLTDEALRGFLQLSGNHQ